MDELNAEDIGRRATVPGIDKMGDLELHAEIARLSQSVASFGGAMLLAAYRQEADRRRQEFDAYMERSESARWH